MEMKKLHMGTMSYGADSMDEVAHQLALAFGSSGEQGKTGVVSHFVSMPRFLQTKLISVKDLSSLVHNSPCGDVEICPPE